MRYMLLLRLCSLFTHEGQTSSQAPDIPKVGVFYFVDATNGSLTPLQTEEWKAGHSSIIRGAYGRKHNVTISLDVEGGHSPFRLATNKPEFVFSFSSPENATMYVSEENKRKRRFAIGTVNANTNKITPILGISVEVTQLGPSSYKLVPKSPLASGEYALTLRTPAPLGDVDSSGSEKTKSKTHAQYFTFGVD